MGEESNFWRAQNQVADLSLSDVGSPVESCPASVAKEFKASRKSGGVTGQVLDVTYEVDSTECTSLQAIQVVWANGGPMTVGKLKMKRGQAGGAPGTYDAFVDGGTNSPYTPNPGDSFADSSKPYYLTVNETSSQVSYDPATKKGSIQIYDSPSAVNSWENVFFETAVVCVNHKGSGKDKILKAFRWGWTGKGTKYRTDPAKGAKKSGLKESNGVSPAFKKVVRHDYPSYSYE